MHLIDRIETNIRYLYYSTILSTVWKLYGNCMGTVWELYGNCMANVWGMYEKEKYAV